MQNLINLDINSLKTSKLNDFEIIDIDELAANIEACGLLSPLTVIKYNDNDYEIIAGERRFEALKKLSQKDKKWATVPCHIVTKDKEDIDDITKQIMIESSNIEVREFDKNKHRLKMVDLINKLEERGDISKREKKKKLSEYIQCSPRYAGSLLNINNKGTEELKEMYKNDKIKWTEAEKMSLMDEEKQKEAIMDIKQGMNPKDAVKKIKGILESENVHNSTNNEMYTSESYGIAFDEDEYLYEDTDYPRSNSSERIDYAPLDDDERSDLLGDDFDPEEFVKNYDTPETSIDTTGRLKIMKQHSEEEFRKRKIEHHKIVKNWLEKIISKKVVEEDLKELLIEAANTIS